MWFEQCNNSDVVPEVFSDIKKFSKTLEWDNAFEIFSNPEIYERLINNNKMVWDFFHSEWYRVVWVEPVWYDYAYKLKNIRKDFEKNKDDTVWIGKEWKRWEEKDFYIPMRGKYSNEFVQRDASFFIINSDAPPVHYSLDIKPLYKITLESSYKNAQWEEIKDFVDIYAYHPNFFDKFLLTLDPEILVDIQSIAEVSYEYGSKFYVWPYEVSEHCYYNYLLFKKDNMISIRETWWKWPKRDAVHKNLTYENFRNFIYRKISPYNQSVTALKELLNK